MDPSASPLPTLALVVPLFDEVALVDPVVADIMVALGPCGDRFRLVLVDNGSSDGTTRRVQQLSSRFGCIIGVYLPQNRGYGGGILAGLGRAWGLEIDGRPADVLGWCWGDGQVDPQLLPQMLRAVQGGSALAKARRTRRQDGIRRVAVSSIYAALSRALGVRVADINGCPKLFPRAVLAELDPRATDWFLDFEAVLGVQERGGRVSQHSAVMRVRTAGRSKVRASTLVEFVYNLARWRITGSRSGARPAIRSVTGGHSAP